MAIQRGMLGGGSRAKLGHMEAEFERTVVAPSSLCQKIRKAHCSAPPLERPISMSLSSDLDTVDGQIMSHPPMFVTLTMFETLTMAERLERAVTHFPLSYVSVHNRPQ